MPILGGFVISIDESLRWASRIAKRPISDEGVGFFHLIGYMEKKGFDVTVVCHPAGISKVMVVTQYGPAINGWTLDSDPTKLPQFKEGLTEKLTRKGLDRAGVVGYEFVTSHGRV